MERLHTRELRKISRVTGIALDKISQWHYVHSPHFVSKHTGRPRGKAERPAGLLSIGDIKHKFKLSNARISRWREEGLATEPFGSMILIRETELTEWMARRNT